MGCDVHYGKIEVDIGALSELVEYTAGFSHTRL